MSSRTLAQAEADLREAVEINTRLHARLAARNLQIAAFVEQLEPMIASLARLATGKIEIKQKERKSSAQKKDVSKTVPEARVRKAGRIQQREVLQLSMPHKRLPGHQRKKP